MTCPINTGATLNPATKQLDGWEARKPCGLPVVARYQMATVNNSIPVCEDHAKAFAGWAGRVERI